MSLVDFRLWTPGGDLTGSWWVRISGGALKIRSKNLKTAFGGTQLAVSVLLGLYVGYRMDARWETGPWLLLAGGALGLAGGLFSFLAPFFNNR